MKHSESESDCELIIDPALLAQIQAHCGKIAAELEAAGQLQRLPIAPGSPQNDFPTLPVPPPISEAEHFAAAVSEMPPKVRAFFEREESPYIPPHRRESDQVRLEREQRASWGWLVRLALSEREVWQGIARTGS
jgi:hypothetical protein